MKALHIDLHVDQKTWVAITWQCRLDSKSWLTTTPKLLDVWKLESSILLTLYVSVPSSPVWVKMHLEALVGKCRIPDHLNNFPVSFRSYKLSLCILKWPTYDKTDNFRRLERSFTYGRTKTGSKTVPRGALLNTEFQFTRTLYWRTTRKSFIKINTLSPILISLNSKNSQLCETLSKIYWSQWRPHQ